MAWMLHYILLFVGLLNIPVQVIAALLLPGYTARAVPFVLTFLAINGCLLVLNHRGHPIAASRLFNLLTWVLLTYSALTAGGLDAPAISAQFLIVSTAGALMGWRWGLGAVIVCTGTVTTLGLMQHFGALPPAVVEHTPLSRLAFLVFYLVTLGFEWTLILVTLRRSRERTESEIADRAAAEQAVRELNAVLECRVAERTAELERAVDELGATNRQLDEASRARSQFIANMSHELRTPLNSIIGFSGILSQQLTGPLNEEQARQLSLVRDAGQRLLVLVNQVLDLSRIEAGATLLAVKDFDAAQFARHVADIVSPLAEEKRLFLVVEEPTEKLAVRADQDRSEQVLLNLLGNAIKFTAQGGVRLTVTTDGELVEFTVHDSGPGVQGPRHDLVFDRFYQAVPPAGGKYEGTGLGLPVARELARVMGGDVKLLETGDRGSTFVFSLPRAPEVLTCSRTA